MPDKKQAHAVEPAKEHMPDVPGKKQVHAAVRVVVDNGVTDHCSTNKLAMKQLLRF
jgi:hypothetical protein